MRARPLLRLLLTAVAAFLVVTLPAGTAHADDGPVKLTITGPGTAVAGKSPVRLDFRVTNTGRTPCRAVRVADGALAITAMTLDGEPVRPTITMRDYLVPLATIRERTAVTLAPGASMPLGVRAFPVRGRAMLPSVSWSETDPYLATLWPVDRPGTYRLTARLAPPLGDPSSGGCENPSGDATVTFTVASGAWWDEPGVRLAGAGAVVLGLLVVLLLLVAGRRRRHRRARRYPRPGPYGAGALVLALALGVLGVTERPAAATLESTGDSAFQARIENCKAKITAAGDPGGVLARSQASKYPIFIIQWNNIPGRPEDSLSWALAHVPDYSTDPRRGSGSEIYWNPGNDYMLDPGVKENECATLVHELSHVADNAEGKADFEECARRGDPTVTEVRATLLENAYRRSMGLPERTSYHGKPLPSSVDKCTNQRFPAKKPGRSGHGSKHGHQCLNGCGSSTGDPHLRTFDQRRYDLQSAGEFVLARATDGSLEVQTRQTPVPGSRTVSTVSAVALKVGGTRIGIYTNPAGSPRVLVDGAAKSLRDGDIALPGGATLYGEAADPDDTGGEGSRRLVGLVTGGTSVLISPVGGWGLEVEVSPAPSLAGKVSGLLGDFDGDPADDLPASSSARDLHGGFADSRRVTAAASLFDYAPGQNTRTFTDRSFPDLDAPGPGSDALAAAGQICRISGVTDPAALKNCAYDVAVTGQRVYADAAARAAGGAEPAPGTGGGTGVPVGSRQPLPAPGANLSFSGTVAQDGQRNEYRLDGTAGQIVYFHGLDTCDDTRILRYSFSSPTGALFPAYFKTCQDGGRLALKETGTHRLIVYGDPGVTGPYRVEIKGVRPDRTATTALGGSLTGSIDMPGAQDVHTFTATAGQPVTFHGQGPCDDTRLLRYTMFAPSGAYGEVAYVRTCQDSGKITLKESGTYKVVVYGEGLSTGPYQVRLG
ncbi:VWD domain-containing protein [Actinomadura scrupuli]|uniref:VWD domain-containing protein n=1 Tax=Actinomadura scrupuli TaxID=559629 RepID=UPI003D9767EA